jgi:hypothetical protein
VRIYLCVYCVDIQCVYCVDIQCVCVRACVQDGCEGQVWIKASAKMAYIYIGRSLTSVIDTAGGGATGGWPSVFGSRSGGRPRPPATPRCQPMGGG